MKEETRKILMAELWIFAITIIVIAMIIIYSFFIHEQNDTGNGVIEGVYSHAFVSGQFTNVYFEGYEKYIHNTTLCFVSGDPCWYPYETLSQLKSGEWYRIYYHWVVFHPRSGYEMYTSIEWDYFVKALDSNGTEYLPVGDI